jgi:hypothetical protein
MSLILWLIILSHHFGRKQVQVDGMEVKDGSESTSTIPIHQDESARRLSAKTDLYTGENVHTISGTVPRTSCPPGKYRLYDTSNLDLLGGQREDGCHFCPRGRYASDFGSTTAQCQGACPVGKYGPRHGLKGVDECELCPPGTYGASVGLKSRSCSGNCPQGTYYAKFGNTRLANCVECPRGYRGWQCTWAVNPRSGPDHDSGHKEPFG